MFGAAGGSPDAVSTRSGDTENAANRPLAVQLGQKKVRSNKLVK